MYEAQIKSKNDFNMVKKFAVYYSDRTRVVSVEDKDRGLLPKNVIAKHVGKAETMVLDFEKSRFTLKNIDDETKAYLDIFGAFNESTSLMNAEKIYYILKNIDGYNTTASFDSLMHHLRKDSKIEDLNCATKARNGLKKVVFADEQKKLWLKQIFSDLNVKAKKVKTVRATITNVIKGASGSGPQRTDVSCQYKCDGSIRECQFFIFGKNNEARERSLIAGNRLNIVIEEGTGKFIEIVPQYMDFSSIERVSPSKEAKKLLRGINVATFRAMYYEYKIRTM